MTEKENRTCNICNHTFWAEANLKNHISKVHEGKLIRKHKCPICRKMFVNKCSVNTHVRNKHNAVLSSPFEGRVTRLSHNFIIFQKVYCIFDEN